MNIDKIYQVEYFTSAGKTSKTLSFKQSCGGKGLNQSVALARAGIKVWHAGYVGTDGEELVQLLRWEGVELDYVQKIDGPTGHAIIQVDKQGQNSILICGGSNELVTCDYIDQVLTHFEAGDFLVLQNEVSNTSYAIQRAKEMGMIVFLNPSPIEHDNDIQAIDRVDYIILNEVEGSILTCEFDDAAILEALHAQYKNASIILTVGKRGVLYKDRNCTLSHGVYDLTAVDTTAAGDTFTGYFIASISTGKSIVEAIEYASIASSLCVSRHGAAPAIPNRTEVEEFKSRCHETDR